MCPDIKVLYTRTSACNVLPEAPSSQEPSRPERLRRWTAQIIPHEDAGLTLELIILTGCRPPSTTVIGSRTKIQEIERRPESITHGLSS